MGTTATSNQEKSELIYTALTRPRKTAIVISSVPVSNPYTGDIENPSLPKQADRKIEYEKITTFTFGFDKRYQFFEVFICTGKAKCITVF